MSIYSLRGAFCTVNLLKPAKVNTYIVYTCIVGKIELKSIYSANDCFKMYYFDNFQEAKT